MISNLVFVYFGIFFTILSISTPLQFPVCKRTDEKFAQCLQSSVELAISKLKEGIPELGAPPMDPMLVPSAVIGSEGKQAVNVVQNFKNIKIHNLSKLKFIEFKHKWIHLYDDWETDSVSVVPEILFEADYVISGHLLLLPIEGNGTCVVKLINPKVRIIHETKIVENKGKEYLKSLGYKMDLNPEKVLFQFNNLFNGNEQLGNELNKVMNENWKVVFDDIKREFESIFEQVLVSYNNLVYSKHEANILAPE